MTNIAKIEDIQNRIFTIRGIQVMLDSDLAEMYQVSTGRLNEQVKRNIERFPDDFMFQLTQNEWQNLISQFAISSWGGRRKLPYVFTEQGIAALSGVLKSKIAIQVNIAIMRAFIQMRKIISTNAVIYQRLDLVEQKQLKADSKFEQIFKALENNNIPPKQGIFYNGQIFDAYTLIADIIRSANQSIILIDNYVDDTVLKQLAKRKTNVEAIIYTNTTNNIIKQDVQKHNRQYQKIKLKKLTSSHDRFLIIDRTTVYHFGASLKDAGKKWFAFSKLNINANDIIEKL